MMMQRTLKILFFLLVVRPLVLVVLGLNIIDRHKLPHTGPAVIAANHNSHLDTLALISLFPLSMVHKLRPVAAADYFLSNRLLAWFSLNVIGIIPISRDGGGRSDIFAGCHAALDAGDILLVFPEGTRGEPEQAAQPKKGLYHLVNARTDTAITPVLIHGLGKVLPRGEAVIVPFNCDIVVGDELPQVHASGAFVELLTNTYGQLKQQCLTCNTLE